MCEWHKSRGLVHISAFIKHIRRCLYIFDQQGCLFYRIQSLMELESKDNKRLCEDIITGDRLLMRGRSGGSGASREEPS